MSSINASVNKEQISVAVSGDGDVSATVSGGIGPSGPTGSAGAAASISVGTVTTGAPGTSASVVNAGSSSAAVLNFTIPAGATGPQGEQGVAGAAGPAGAKGDKGDTGANGAAGAQGPAGVVSASSPLTYNSGTQTVGLGNSGVAAGTYSSVTVNAQGIVTAGGSHSVGWSDIGSKPETFPPSSHSHGYITADGKLGTTANLLVVTGANGAVTTSGAITVDPTYGHLNVAQLNIQTGTNVASLYIEDEGISFDSLDLTVGNWNASRLALSTPISFTGANAATDIATTRTNLGLSAVAASGSYNDLTNKPAATKKLWWL